MTTRHRLDPELVRDEAWKLACAVDSGKFSEAIAPRNRLADLGLVVHWQPGRAKVAREAERREGTDISVAEKISRLGADEEGRGVFYPPPARKSPRSKGR